MATASETISFRVEPQLKKEAGVLFERLGMDTSTALKMFMTQSVREQKIPFESRLEIPNRRTKAALREAEAIKSGKKKAKKYDSFKDALKDLGYEI